MSATHHTTVNPFASILWNTDFLSILWVQMILKLMYWDGHDSYNKSDPRHFICLFYHLRILSLAFSPVRHVCTHTHTAMQFLMLLGLMITATEKSGSRYLMYKKVNKLCTQLKYAFTKISLTYIFTCHLPLEILTGFVCMHTVSHPLYFGLGILHQRNLRQVSLQWHNTVQSKVLFFLHYTVDSVQ